MKGKEIRAWISGHRWPLYLAGILLMSITAQSIMVYYATRPNAPRPIEDYYQKSMDWDADRAIVAASLQLGWVVSVDVPDLPHDADMPRPVDVVIRDREGQPVTGLAGDLVVIRPADGRLNTKGRLVELPHEPGRYRTLVALPAAGLWELDVDTARGDLRFVHQARVTLPAERAGGTP